MGARAEQVEEAVHREGRCGVLAGKTRSVPQPQVRSTAACRTICVQNPFCDCNLTRTRWFRFLQHMYSAAIAVLREDPEAWPAEALQMEPAQAPEHKTKGGPPPLPPPPPPPLLLLAQRPAQFPARLHCRSHIRAHSHRGLCQRLFATQSRSPLCCCSPKPSRQSGAPGPSSPQRSRRRRQQRRRCVTRNSKSGHQGLGF